MKTIVVLAAIVEREGRLLVTRRLENTHLAGYWEFPGGKCDPHETHAACLARELEEELGVRAIVGNEVLVTEHEYPERRVRLHFRECEIEGEPEARLGQELRWVERSELRTMQFPDADRELIEKLSSKR